MSELHTIALILGSMFGTVSLLVWWERERARTLVELERERHRALAPAPQPPAVKPRSPPRLKR